MKKVLTLLLAATIFTATLTGCGESNDESSMKTSEATTPEITTAEIDTLQTTEKQYYKTIRIQAYAYDMIIGLDEAVPSATFGVQDYLPTLTLHYNVDTGKLESAEYTTYYFYQPEGEDEDLQSDLDILSSGEGELLSRFSNIRTENIDAETITKVTFDIDISTYLANFIPEINVYFVEGEQDVDGYKEAVYYGVVDGYYDPKPTCEDGDGYFFDQISNRRIEWTD